ncbi:hypothetical protein POTOM_025228 [Populus tomentosa]|uniref:Alpha 1,4-glycosyltransferase domain-containing protein n=1 Tax=Populus tomentosa TaxID=118781 RepID=A0A8X8CWY9_POPTO|nr:hypothetical protein POTOM_025228 [Populus tomentosa]
MLTAIIMQPLRSVQKVIKEVHHIEHQSSVIPPFNLTEEIAWFRKKKPGFDILKSNNLTNEFHGRFLEFFSNECTVQISMTWISPVASFERREFLALEKLLQLPDLSFMFKKTPAETWFEEMKSGNKDPGEIPMSQNLSNLIILAVLNKYGGIYLDTDFIVLNKYGGLRNAIGAQSIDVSKNWTRLNNAVLVFDMNHPLLFKFIEEFASTFDGNKWGHKGPYLISRFEQKVAERPGYNFTILPPMAFYPAGWNRIGGFFKKSESNAESRWVNAKLLQLISRETYGIHVWNRQSSRFSIEEGSVGILPIIWHIHLHSLSEFVDGLIFQPLPVTVSRKVISVMLNSVVMGLKIFAEFSFQVFPTNSVISLQ